MMELGVYLFEDSDESFLPRWNYEAVDERDAIQRKVFTRWVNIHFKKVRLEVKDLFEDFRDGNYLLVLLEILSGEKLVQKKERGVLRFHRLQNVQVALDFLESKKIKTVNIRSDEIVDGNPKLTLGLIWIIILHFQISDVKVLLEEEKLSPKEILLLWCKELSDGYPGVKVQNFTTSWKDGLAFNAVIHRHRPDLIDYSWVQKADAATRLENAFTVAERDLGLPKLLDVEDMLMEKPDDKVVLTYVSTLYRVLPSIPPHVQVQAEEERQAMLKEYCIKAKKIINWIKIALRNVNNREFPETLDSMKNAEEKQHERGLAALMRC